MQRNRYGVLLLLLLLFIPSGVASEAHATDRYARYCQQAQQIIADTDLKAEVHVHEDYDSFVKSKAVTNPLTVQMYASNPALGQSKQPRVLSCKMKPAERLNAAAGAADDGDIVARGDHTCADISRVWLEELLERIPADELALSPDSLIVDAEEMTYMGPLWLRPWPFVPLVPGSDGNQWHIRSRALYVPFSWWVPMPDRFKGNYYCHLISPLYLEAVLRGKADTYH